MQNQLKTISATIF